MNRTVREDPSYDGVMVYGAKSYNKEQFIELIERNFSDDSGRIVVITTVENGTGITQSFAFSKIIDTDLL